jgi:hypothetical protein
MVLRTDEAGAMVQTQVHMEGPASSDTSALPTLAPETTPGSQPDTKVRTLGPSPLEPSRRSHGRATRRVNT